jgi:hypothetical protein
MEKAFRFGFCSLALLAAGCAADVPEEDVGASSAALATCTAYGAPVSMGTIEWTVANPSKDQVNEGSGIAASWIHDSVYYVIDDGSAADNGADARFFAIDRTGKARGRFKLSSGAANVDWEDVAVGPCKNAGLGAGSCVFIADVGNNGGGRVKLDLYVMPEPTNTGAGFDTRAVSNWKKFTFQYAGGITRNAESLLVHPVTGDVYVVTKKGGDAEVFKMPAPLTSSMVAQRIALLPQTRFHNAPFTGADFHPDGRRVILRTSKDGGTLTEIRNTGSGWDDVWATATSTVVGPFATPSEGQAEAVTYSRSGVSLYTFGEGTGRDLNRTGCRP